MGKVCTKQMIKNMFFLDNEHLEMGGMLTTPKKKLFQLILLSVGEGGNKFKWGRTSPDFPPKNIPGHFMQQAL